MEVADQWKREWAGKAEYGKIIEGGVTRQIARAMEVLHASAPGARVRVMRAAYHTSAAPGVPASSYMMHASRRVYSSGFNSGFLEPPSLPSEPLEISSTPLALLQETHPETENYKVTEPDDLDISEPSKWRSSTGGPVRMPSEESSSTDNASIIDVSRNHKNTYRKYSYDSENSDLLSGRSSRLSPLLDAPALSTLKFKSLLNGNNDWNNRRKSYSFEDTSPLSESILHRNDTLAMESSTDSGICKSTELVNDCADENLPIRYFGSTDRNDNSRDGTFENWLSKNKQNNYYKGTKFKTYNHEKINEDPKENITLQSTGKVTITLPVTLETEQEYETRKTYEENQRKIKKVEFCKTELHFAAETGKVNIIATDEKPPPSNDFRKRRSAFVPMRDLTERPITLFGDKTNDCPNESIPTNYMSDYNETDENTAATKSILKNKIPKPKPYLLGENMAFGVDSEPKNNEGNENSFVPTAVSLINKQLQAERQNGEISNSFLRQKTVSTNANIHRTTKLSPADNVSSKDQYETVNATTQKVVRIQDYRNKLSPAKRNPIMARSPTPARLKTRELRDSDLTYFGVDDTLNNHPKLNKPSDINQDSELNELFQSVRLIQQVSNSVCNSESEDYPEYQNLPINSNYVPKPTPRIRTKYGDKPNYIEEIVLKPIVEQETGTRDNSYRRSKTKLQELEVSSMKSRSRSEPRKSEKINSTGKKHLDQFRKTRDHSPSENKNAQAHHAKITTHRTRAVSEDDNPIYVNLKIEPTKYTPKPEAKPRINTAQKVPNNNLIKSNAPRRSEVVNTKCTGDNHIKRHQPNDGNASVEKKKSHFNRDAEIKQNEKADSHLKKQKLHSNLSNERSSDITNTYGQAKKEHRSRSSQRRSQVLPDNVKDENVTLQSTKDSKDKTTHNEMKTKRHSSKDNNSNKNDITLIPKVGTNSSRTSKVKDARHSSKPSRREIVINYDDKNGTVSSICKVRSGSTSPRRKKGNREVVKEKFKENLRHKSSDKAALLQIEDHQWDLHSMYSMNGYQKRKRQDKIRSCQVL